MINLTQFQIPSDIELPLQFNPLHWDSKEITTILDIAEKSIRSSVSNLRLRAKVLRKDRAVGLYPGGDEMTAVVPKG